MSEGNGNRPLDETAAPGESRPGDSGPRESGPGESGPGESGPGESGPGEPAAEALESGAAGAGTGVATSADASSGSDPTEAMSSQSVDRAPATPPPASTSPASRASEPAPPPESGPGGPPRAPRNTSFRLVLTVAVIASLLAAFFWWQSRASLTTLAEQNQALEDRNRALGDELSATRAQVAAFDEQIAGLEGELEGNSTRVTALSEDVTALPPEIRELERRIETLQGGRLDARAIWLKEQAEYYLVLANTELTLGRRVGTAVDALELADDVLRDLGDPDLARVRNAISAELQALRAVEQPDLERLTGDLSGLEDRAANLPMRAQTPENFVVVDENQDAEDEPGLGRLWSATKGAMRSIVRVERQEEPVDQLLTESERRIVRRQLELELSLARTALLDRRQADFRAALVAADGILNREFNREAQSVVAARELLASMMQVELAPALPSIGDSLSLLRSAPGGD